MTTPSQKALDLALYEAELDLLEAMFTHSKLVLQPGVKLTFRELAAKAIEDEDPKITQALLAVAYATEEELSSFPAEIRPKAAQYREDFHTYHRLAEEGKPN